MHRKHLCTSGSLSFFILTFVTLGLAFQDPCLAKNYIEINKRKVNIRLSPSTSSRVVTRAKNGDIFELKSESRQWYKIHAFSGDLRYVHKSLAKKVRYEPESPENLSTRRELFKAWIKAQYRAEKEAALKYLPGNDLKKHIKYKRILDDQYKLGVMHQFKVQPPIYRRIVIEGFQKGW